MPHKSKEEYNKYRREYEKKRLANDPDYREAKRATARKAARVRKQRVRNIVNEAKDKPCTDCGEKYPYQVMDLDHVQGEKEFNISKAINGAEGYISYDRLRTEIAKCEPRCPTCHRLRHFKEHYDNWEALCKGNQSINQLPKG